MFALGLLYLKSVFLISLSPILIFVKSKTLARRVYLGLNGGITFLALDLVHTVLLKHLTR